MSSTVKNESDFGQGSIYGHIFRLAIPLATAQIISLLYNIVDRIYIGRLPIIGTDALTGLGVVMPVITLITGLTNMCGMGGNPLCSIARGANDIDRAEKIMATAYTMILWLSIISIAIVYLFEKPILYFLGASDSTYIYAKSYINIYILGTTFYMIAMGMAPFINSQGFAKYGMYITSSGAILNILLDPLFIFTFKLGIAGAAIATVISQILTAVLTIKFLMSKKAVLKFSYKPIKLNFEIVKEISLMGVSPLFMQATNSIILAATNASLKLFGGDIWIAVMTIISSVKEIAIMVIHGFTYGATPVISFNYGAKKYSRVTKGIMALTFLCVSYGILFFILVSIFPGFFVGIFTNDPSLFTKGELALKIYFSCYAFMGLMSSGQNSFLAVGKFKHSLFFTFFRKIFVNLPLVLILPRATSLGIIAVLLAEPISDVCGGLASWITMFFKVYKPNKKLVAENNE